MAISCRVSLILLATPFLQASKNWDLDEQAASRKWGSLLHLILAQINVPEDVAEILNNCESDGIITREEKADIAYTLDRFLTQPEVSKYFAQGLNVKTEPEILLPGGKTYRPDRIVFLDRETIVIDFKTGKAEDSHKEQVLYYIKLMKEMGYTNMKGVLLYIIESASEVVVSGQ